MAKAEFDVAAVIERFTSALKQQGLNVERVILLGSQARGTVKEHSDIDLLVVSPDFADMPLVCQRRGKIYVNRRTKTFW